MARIPGQREYLGMLVTACQHLQYRLGLSALFSTFWKRRAHGLLSKAWLSHSLSHHGPSHQSPFLGETGSACQAVCKVSTSRHSEASAKLRSPQWGVLRAWPFSFTLSQL